MHMKHEMLLAAIDYDNNEHIVDLSELHATFPNKATVL